MPAGIARSFGIDPANGRELRYLQIAKPLDLRGELLPPAPFVCLVAWHVERATIGHVVAALLDAGASCVSAFGRDCGLLHDWIDETVVMRNIDRDRDDHVMTQWHDQDTQDDVLNGDFTQMADGMLVLEIGEVFADRERVLAALSDPVAFAAGYEPGD